MEGAEEVGVEYCRIKRRQAYKPSEFRVGMLVGKRDPKKAGHTEAGLQPDWLNVYQVIEISGQKVTLKNVKTDKLLKPVSLGLLKPVQGVNGND